MTTLTYNSGENISTLINTTNTNTRHVEGLFTDTEAIMLGSAFGVLSLIGLFANGLTIYVLQTTKSLRSVFNYFILSLAVSDLMSALFSPLYVYKDTLGFLKWELPHFLCTAYWSIDVGTSVLTSLHILVFSILRFLLLKWPHTFTKFKMSHAKQAIFMLWMISICGGFVPFAIWMGVTEIDATLYDQHGIRPCCNFGTYKNAEKEFAIYSLTGYPLFFLIPCILISITSCGASLLIVSRRVERTRKNKRKKLSQWEDFCRKKENQAVLQMLLIVFSYMTGYVPNIAFCIFISIDPNNTKNLRFNLVFSASAYITLRFSECLNPIFYNLGSSKIRVETLKNLKKIFPCCFKQKPATQSFVPQPDHKVLNEAVL